MHFVGQSGSKRRATDAEQAHHITPADPANFPHGPLPVLIVLNDHTGGAGQYNLAPRDRCGMRRTKGGCHRVLRYIASRLVIAAAMVLLATLIIFLIANTVPGDPVLTQLGDIAANNPAIVEAYRHKWGLDLPMWERYWIFLRGLTHGDLGISISSQRPVIEDIAQYAPATIELSTVAFLLSLIFGLPLGVVAAMKRDSWIDHIARVISLTGVSAPTFWLAFIMLAVFYGWLGWAPGPGQIGSDQFPPPDVTGFMLIDAPLAGQWDTFWDAITHLILPSIVLASATMGLITRTTRAAMLEALSQDYIRVARAKGLTRHAIMLRHALPNALLPVVTLGGLAYAQLLTGTVLTETIFSWPGLGRYTFQSAVILDFPAIMGITLVVAIVYVIVNLIVDVSYALLDPRVMRR
jgi:peptide/nickel transport system permease protein